MPPDSHAFARQMREHLQRLRMLRGTDAQAALGPALPALKTWQGQRLAATYADLAAEPRYREATAFFLRDLYGPKDFSGRDAGMLRILPVMERVLPAKAVETAAMAIEIEALSEDLDHRLAAALGRASVDEDRYAAAYRVTATRAERLRQIELIVEVGRRLDELVKYPMLLRTIRLMRAPSRLAGLGDLNDFLERGFLAFRAMGGASVFLSTIESRETTILNRLFSGAPRPFSV